MLDRAPAFRADISIDVHQEHGEAYLILHDPFGAAEGPIMVHADMVDVLELCNGNVTWEEIARQGNVPMDGPEMMRVRAFIGQLDQMGYLETEHAHTRHQNMIDEWSARSERPAVCAGATYPAHPTELRDFLDVLCGIDDNSATTATEPQASGDDDRNPPGMILMPHIDFRVANGVYASAARHLRECTAELFVMIGTSHYWYEDLLIPTTKNYVTPLGTLPTDRKLVEALHSELAGRGLGYSSTDVAHKPEHSLELHAVLLQHLLPRHEFTVLPILVGGMDAPDGQAEMEEFVRVASALQTVVAASGKKVCWLVSGDLSHYGKRFGDAAVASAMHTQVRKTDAAVLEALKRADAHTLHTTISASGNATNICGHAPLVLSLCAAQPHRGEVLAYEQWDDSPTSSAVTFASVAWW